MELSIPDQKRLRSLMRVFLAENQNINLSAYRTEEQCWVGNVLDSVAGVRGILEYQSIGVSGGDIRVIDIGMGGGFPLLPLAMLLSEVRFTGMDATRKKVDAVGRIIEEMGISNVQLVTGRAEELAKSEGLRKRFDIALSRAVAPLPKLLPYMSPFVREGGVLLCWKSMHIDEELESSKRVQKELKCQLVDQIEYELPGDWGSRQILVYEKMVV